MKPNVLIAAYMRQRNRWKQRRNRICQIASVLIQRRWQLLRLIALIQFVLLQSNVETNIDSLSRRKTRSCRRLERNSGWWRTVWNEYSEDRFKKDFRISKCTFNLILEKIRHRLEKEEVTEEPISPEMRLGICLYKLARGDYNYTLGEMAGIAESTVCVIIKEVCIAIVEEMWTDHVEKYFPKSLDDFAASLMDMEAQWQFGYAFAAIDGSHIPIKCPPGGAEAMKQYYNFKNFYSIILLAMVDANYRFIWATCGAPGNSHDSTLFQSSSLWDRIVQGDIIPERSQTVNGEEIPPLILGDGAFPMRSWLAKPYSHAVLTPEERYFNYRLSRARMVTEGAFGRLKSRFRVLHRKCESSKETVKLMTLACVVLHNLSIDTGDLIPRKCDLTLNPSTQKLRSTEEIRDILDLTNPSKNLGSSPSLAKRIRNVIKDIFWKEKEDALEREE